MHLNLVSAVSIFCNFLESNTLSMQKEKRTSFPVGGGIDM